MDKTANLNIPFPIVETNYRSRVKNELTALKYTHRKTHRHHAEMALIEQAISFIPITNPVLDIPCGAGRVAILLARKGYKAIGADLSKPMIDIARDQIRSSNIDCAVQSQDIEKMSFQNNEFGVSICFRFFHHLPDAEIRRHVIGELCRVSRNYVLISYLSPASYTMLKRRMRVVFGGKKSYQFATPLSELEKYFSEQGFELTKDFAQMPFFHTLHLAIFKRAVPNPTRIESGR